MALHLAGEIPAADTSAEAEAVKRVLAGEKEAYSLVLALHAGAIQGYLYNLLHRREDAEDLMQETFLRAYAHLRDFDTRRSLRPWLLAIARNLALDQLGRKSIAHVHIGPADIAMENLAEHRPSPAEQAIHGERSTLLEAVLSTLEPAEREVIHLHYREEMPLRDIAALTGRSPGAIRVALHRARESMRQKLKKIDPEAGNP